MAQNLLEDLLNQKDQELDRQPRHRQIYQKIRLAILDQRLASDCLLPPTRHLAKQLGVSRNTVISAYEQLQAEGLVVSQKGSGTRVSIYQKALKKKTPKPSNRQKPILATRVSKLNVALSPDLRLPSDCFLPGLPDMSLFPYSAWNRLFNRYGQQMSRGLNDLDLAAGHQPLRQLLAQYLNISRGLNVHGSQVFITAGASQSLQLISKTLTNAGDTVWFEEPGYNVARASLQLADLNVLPVPVDQQGITLDDDLIKNSPSPTLIYATSSHQYPLGHTLSNSRRLELLELAKQQNCWLIEDDYDGELRYQGHSIPALAGLNNNQKTLYMGTFSKVLSPHLRMSYLVVPENLIEAFRQVYPMFGNESSVSTQATLAEYISRGFFTSHIKRMRKIYGQRRESLLSELAAINTPKEKINPGGLHIPLRIDQNDMNVVASAMREGFACLPLSSFYQGEQKENGLLLGFTSVAEEELQAGAKKLKRILGY